MFKTHLYGYPIVSDIQLIETGHEMKPLTRVDTPLTFEKVKSGQALKEFHVDAEMHAAHGRNIKVRSDRVTSELFEHQPWCFEVENVVAFYGEGGDHRIYYLDLGQATESLISFWFVHIVLPFFLTVERSYCFLHAAAVNSNEQSIMFIADSHSGKSTLANHFLSSGYRLVSDDKVAITKLSGVYHAVPSHPYYRPYRSHEELGFHSDFFAAHARPLKAIYLLDREDSEKVSLEPILGIEAVRHLMVSCLHLFPVFQAERLDFLGSLAAEIPMFRLNRQWGLEHMDDVYNAVSTHPL